MTRPRYFVILGAMRTGSNLLEQTIAGLPGTVCHGEAFNPAFVGGPRHQGALGWTVARRDAEPLGFLAAMLADAGDRLAGFRLFDGHDERVLEHVLRDPACARIVLRRDPVRSYVSLLIARRTDQWLLRNPRRRQSARVGFDPAEFDRYRAALDAHYDRIGRAMAAAGTSALRLDYEDLADPALPDRLAAFLGLPARSAVPPDLVRQNPEPLRDLVSNYAAMCAHLGFDPDPDPQPTEPLPGPDMFHLSRQAPLALAPLIGPGTLPALTLMHRIDCLASGDPPLGRARMLERFAAGTLATTGKAEDRYAFAVLSHPAERLQWLMYRELYLLPGSPARVCLLDNHPGIPTEEGWTAWTAARRHAVLAGFLDLVEGALDGTGTIPCPAAWRPQAEIMAAVHAAGRNVRLFRSADFDGLVAEVCDGAGIAPFPPGQRFAISSMDLRAGDPPPPELAARAARLHARDLDEFGTLIGG